MEKQDNKDIMERMNDYLLSGRSPLKSKVKKSRHINIRLPDELLETLQDWSYRNNRSLSHTIRGFLYLAELENLYDLKQWLLNCDDTRDFNDLVKKGGDNNE